MLTVNPAPEIGMHEHPSAQGVVSLQAGCKSHDPWRAMRVVARAVRTEMLMKATRASVTVAKECMVDLSVAENRDREVSEGLWLMRV